MISGQLQDMNRINLESLVSMDNVAVIDIGSARIKYTIASFDSGKMQLIKLKEEISLSANLSSTNILDEAFVENQLAEALLRFSDLAKEHHCKRLLTLGTHALRKAVNADNVITAIEKCVGKLNIIPAWLEGAVFYSHLKKQISGTAFGVVDIGGGSVQISFGDGEGDVYSMPTGTYSLEEMFQKRKDTCLADELDAMRAYIRGSLNSLNTPKAQLDVLVMGSSCMEDFMNSALKASNIVDKKQFVNHLAVNSLNTVNELLNEIKGKPYDSLERYYPDNKYFMYGADKALLNLLEICRLFNVNYVLPTNESVSTAIIGMLSRTPDMLEHYGISYHPL